MTKDDTIARALLDAASTSLIPALAGGLLVLLTNYVSSPNGSVSIGEPMKIQGSGNLYILPIDIVSYRNDSNLAISFEINPPLRMTAISSSRPVILSEVTIGGYSEKQLLQVKDIPGEARTRLFVKTGSASSRTIISVRNAEKDRLLVDRDYAVKTKMQIITEGLPVLVVYFLAMSTAAAFLFERLFLLPLRESLAKSRKEASDLAALAEDYKGAIASTELELKRIKAYALDERNTAMRERLKVRCLLISRISDLRKELDFWRDTLRSYVARAGIPEDKSEQLIRLIPEKLKTWSTLSDERDSISLRVAAGLLERGTNDTASSHLTFWGEDGQDETR